MDGPGCDVAFLGTDEYSTYGVWVLYLKEIEGETAPALARTVIHVDSDTSVRTPAPLARAAAGVPPPRYRITKKAAAQPAIKTVDAREPSRLRSTAGGEKAKALPDMLSSSGEKCKKISKFLLVNILVRV